MLRNDYYLSTKVFNWVRQTLSSLTQCQAQRKTLIPLLQEITITVSSYYHQSMKDCARCKPNCLSCSCSLSADRTIGLTLVITGVGGSPAVFTPALSNSNSPQFRALAASLQVTVSSINHLSIFKNLSICISINILLSGCQFSKIKKSPGERPG